MKLKNLYLRRETWGPNEGRIVGSVEFENGHGEIKLNLCPDASDRILTVVADCLVDSAKETAHALTASIIYPTKDAA